jgi:hypothetical protein
VIVPGGIDADVFQMPQLEKALGTHLECRHWAIPHTMLPVLGQLFDSPWQDGIDALWREGVALQLLALGLQAEDLQTDRCARCAPASVSAWNGCAATCMTTPAMHTAWSSWPGWPA